MAAKPRSRTNREGQSRRCDRCPRSRARSASPTNGRRSRTTSRSEVTTATSPSVCTRTAGPGEVFFRVTKEGSTVNGLMDSLGISMSMALQHGVPLKDLVRKLAHLRFEPAGATNNPKVRFAKSIPDYVARWLALEFLTEEDRRSIRARSPRGGEWKWSRIRGSRIDPPPRRPSSSRPGRSMSSENRRRREGSRKMPPRVTSAAGSWSARARATPAPSAAPRAAARNRPTPLAPDRLGFSGAHSARARPNRRASRRYRSSNAPPFPTKPGSPPKETEVPRSLPRWPVGPALLGRRLRAE